MLAPWKKSYDQIRQHIKKQRHYFANRCPSSQSYGFSSNHVWIWELEYSESWVPKNWCFWTVVLEKTLETPLDCKEIKPVIHKGKQSWIFIGRTDAEAETPIIWPPDVKNRLTGKDPDSGKDLRQEEKRMTEDEMVGWMASPNWWAWVWASSGCWWWTRKPGILQMGSQRVRHTLNWKQCDNIQPLCMPFPIWNQFIVPCPVLTGASPPAIRFLRRQIRWSGIPNSNNFPEFAVIQKDNSFSTVNEADVYLEFSCFFYEPTDVGNLISGSSAFSKSSLNIWSFQFTYCWSLAWRILSISLLDCEMSAVVQYFENSSELPFFGIEMKTDLFKSCNHCCVFQICWHIECSTFTASSFRIWNSSAGIPSLPLALFLLMLPKGEISLTSDMQITRPLRQKVKRN